MTFYRRRRAKYGAVPTEVDGIRFASKKEARRYQELKILVAASSICYLVLQPRFKLPGGITYVGDFQYVERDTKRVVVEDVKGFQTPAFKLKAKLFRATYPDLELRIV